MNRLRISRAGMALCAALVLWSGSAAATTLITDEEARRPDDAQAVATRGITRGPTIRFEAPAVAPTAHKPFDFRIHFEPHGGSKIEPASVHVTYLKMPSVDLTDRLRSYSTDEGISMTAAQVPAGEHAFRVEVQDSEGRTGEAVFSLKVDK